MVFIFYGNYNIKDITLIASNILVDFRQFTGDSTELSDTDSLRLLNAKYMKVLSSRTWRFLFKAGTGTIANNQISLPTDFFFIPITSNADISNEGQERYVYVGSTLRPYKIVNFEDRLQYVDQDGYCYIDIPNSKLIFTKTPIDTSVYYTYCYLPAELAISDSPIFPTPFHNMLYYAMVSDEMICQLFDKARSYANETEAKYEDILNDLIIHDSKFLMQ